MKKRTLFLIFLGVLFTGATVFFYKFFAPIRYEANLAHLSRFDHFVDGQRVYGVKAGEACKPAVLFIHGAPGSWKAWARYLGDDDLLAQVSMIAVDRPGYGFSDVKDGLSLPLVGQSSAIMGAVLKEHKGPFLIVGHSYGGPIQARMAIDYPKNVSGLLILAGAVDPKLHRPRPYHRLANMWPFNAMLPFPLQVANDEMMALDRYLKNDLLDASKIEIPTTVIQGRKDWLVPHENVRFIEKTFVKSEVNTISLDKEGHFIPWEQYDLVRDQILKKAKYMKAPCENAAPE